MEGKTCGVIIEKKEEGEEMEVDSQGSPKKIKGNEASTQEMEGVHTVLNAGLPSQSCEQK